MTGEASAALLVRVWVEAGPEAFRARLTRFGGLTGDRALEDLTVTVASSRDGVLTVLTEWLDEFVRLHGDTPEDQL